jgi:hypothetical protein
MRASADQPGGWIVQETFRLEPCEPTERVTSSSTREQAGTSLSAPTGQRLPTAIRSEDIRLRTHVTVDGEPVAPRPVVTHGLDAAGFDEPRGTEIVDRAKVSGDAVTPTCDGPGEPPFHAHDFGAGVAEVTMAAAGAGSAAPPLTGGPARRP